MQWEWNSWYMTLMRYWPNPAHKRETTEAGPPRWGPHKDFCPNGMTVQERNALLQVSLPTDVANPRSRRYVVRRTLTGPELYDIKWTRDVEGEPEFHGHPATRIKRSVLRALRDAGQLTEPEYQRFARDLP